MRIPWNKYEAALLIEAYYSSNSKEISRPTTVKTASNMLRGYAKALGLEIDETFRNINGINMRMYELDYISSKGKKGMKNTSSVFKDMMQMYHSNRGEFEKILQEAWNVLGMSQANERKFIEWLANHLKSGQHAQIYSSLRVLNVLCRQKKIFEVSLLAIRDSKELKRVKIKVIDENALALQEKKLLRFSQLLNFYEIFLEEDQLKIDVKKKAMEDNLNQDMKNEMKMENEQVGEWEGLETKLLEADLDGISAQKLSEDIGKSVYQIKKHLKNRLYAVAMPGDIFIHVDNIIDLHESRSEILKILSSQFEKFAGYTNDEIMYDAAKITMTMFLNDNAIDTPKKFYAIVKYLFQKKESFNGSFIFEADKHIWEKQPAYPLSNAGVLLGYMDYCGGRITKEECISYLENIKLPSGNINGLLSMGTNSQVLFYGEKEYVLAKKIITHEAWLNDVREWLFTLLKEQDYVIFREIGDNWFRMLPVLGDGLDWNILLLQDLIKKYFPEFRLIVANENQRFDTIRAGFVQDGSIIESFADLVYARIQEDSRITLPQRMKAEELRQKLISYGMIQGNELIYVMPQALDDMRFAWNSEGDSVLIRLVNR